MRVRELREILAGMDDDLHVVVHAKKKDGGEILQREVVSATRFNQMWDGASIQPPYCVILTRSTRSW